MTRKSKTGSKIITKLCNSLPTVCAKVSIRRTFEKKNVFINIKQNLRDLTYVLTFFEENLEEYNLSVYNLHVYILSIYTVI